MRCIVCDNNVEKVSRALCKKLLGKSTKQIRCLSCLANFLDTDEEELLEKAAEFKEEGCTLFK